MLKTKMFRNRNSASGSLPPDKRVHPPRPAAHDYLHDPLQVGLMIVGTTAALGGLGWWLDSRLHTFPILMAIGAAAGLFGIMYQIYLRLRATDAKPTPPDDGERRSDA
jgi:hypothetical protein